jgi:hypothetical protein
MKHSRWALGKSACLALVCLFSFLTLFTWPDFVDGSWKLSRPPAWWQFEIFASIGLLLTALPSFVIYRLDAFFQVHGQLRNPMVVLLLTIEVAVLCYVVHRAARSLERRA